MRQLRMHMLAAQGYCVVAIDSRGSQHRGLQFESYLRGRMVCITKTWCKYYKIFMFVSYSDLSSFSGLVAIDICELVLLDCCV